MTQPARDGRLELGTSTRSQDHRLWGAFPGCQHGGTRPRSRRDGACRAGTLLQHRDHQAREPTSPPSPELTQR